MKNRINNLFFFLLWAIVVFLFFSCGKKEPVKPSDPVNVVECDFPAELTTLAEVMKTIEFEGLPHWSVAIKISNFIGGVKKFVVYNPYDKDLNYYDSPEFSIYWFRDGKLIGHSIQIDCDQKGEYAVLVLNNSTKRGVEIDFYEIIKSCYLDDV